MPKCKLCKSFINQKRLTEFGNKNDSPLEKESGLCFECLGKPFPITSVARADMLAKGIEPKDVAKFDDDDMEILAEKMADAYTSSDAFWIELEIIAEDMIDDKILDAKKTNR